MELLKSPAKINLFLDVLSKDNDGFHNIKSILTLIDLHDEIIIKDSESLDINFSGEFSNEINQNNIQILFDFLIKKNFIKSGKYSINIRKNIPVGAGLGGGSSNIAPTEDSAATCPPIGRINKYKTIGDKTGNNDGIIISLIAAFVNKSTNLP